MILRSSAPTLLLVFLLASPSGADAQASTGGFGVRYAIPWDTFADTHDRGWGITWGSVANMGGTWLSMGGGFTRFEPLAPLEGEGEPSRIDQAEVTMGLGVQAGQLRLGARAGYFFRDEDEWDLMPVASLRFGPFLLTGEAKVLGDVRWYGGSVSWLSR